MAGHLDLATETDWRPVSIEDLHSFCEQPTGYEETVIRTWESTWGKPPPYGAVSARELERMFVEDFVAEMDVIMEDKVLLDVGPIAPSGSNRLTREAGLWVGTRGAQKGDLIALTSKSDRYLVALILRSALRGDVHSILIRILNEDKKAGQEEKRVRIVGCCWSDTDSLFIGGGSVIRAEVTVV
jgi:hypothetical protein